MTERSAAKAPKKPAKSFWVCWRPKDALDGMSQLTPTEELAYRRILDMIFATDDRLLDDDKTLGWSTRAGRQWKAVKAALISKGKITVADGFVRNAKATETCIETRAFRAQKIAAAVASHQSPKRLKNNDTTSADADTSAGTDAEPHAHASLQLPSGSLRSPDGGGGEDLFTDHPPGPPARKGPPRRKPPAEPDPNRSLFDDCAAKLSGLTGKPATSFYSLLKGWTRDTGGDAAAVAGYVDDAHRRGLAKPVPAIIALVRSYSRAAPDAAGDGIPEHVNDWPVREVAGYARNSAQVDGTRWPGLEAVIARELAAGADPERHIYPAMEEFRRSNPDRIGMGLITTAIRDRCRSDAAARQEAA